MVAGMLWVGVAALTVLLLWPALWAAPAQAVASVASEAAGNSTEPHKGNFLLGQSFLFDAPGPLYYPVTLFSRLTPWVLLGLLLAAAVPLSWRGPRRVPMLLLLCAALLFVAILSTLPKKLDRYALPAVPLLHILAAAGLALLWDRLRATGQRMQDDWHRLHRSLLPPLFFLVLALTLVIYHPYYLAYYSPLTGLLRPLGSAETERAHPVTDVVLVGWGEGLDRAADWLNAQPGIEAGEVATWSAPTLRPYLDTGVTWQGDTDERDRVNYLVVYVNQEQTGREAQYIDQVHGRCPVSHTVRLHGIDYAWIYELPLVRIAQPPGAQFGQVFTLADYVLEPPDACDCSPLTLTLAFQPLSRPEQPHFFFIHVIDSSGRMVQQLDIPLENLIVSAAWQSGETLFHPLGIPLPETAPPGDYRVIVGLYEPGTGAQVPITVNAGQEASTGAGTGTLHIATFQKTRIYQQQCAAP
jgi:hypothetical protein